jgi:glucosyl-3-phosphoglycerate synthase
MWQGLASTDADIVVFIDADLQRFDTRFVTALLGPLLADPTVEFVKAAYDRPAADSLRPSVGGGRVTELMARPLIAAFWPALGGVIQPLSGEYAARRALLEALPFRCGYGVDVGLLVDAGRAVGVNAIAQVDLYQRHHHSSDLTDLGRMAAEILHTVLDRAASEGRARGADELSNVLRQPRRLEGGFALGRHQVDTAERPPLRESRGIAAHGAEGPGE